MDSIAIGVDIGGSHISCAAIDLTSHRIISGTAAEQKINNKASAAEILEGWSAAIARTISDIEKQKLTGIGFAMPGPFDYPKGIALFEKVEKYENLYGINVSDELRKRLQLEPNVKIRYINDATAFAIAEAWIGKASSFDKVIALTLGTGFGSAFIDKGIPVLNEKNVPEMGCIWHIPYKEGIANDYFSTPWFTRNYLERTGIVVQGVREIAGLAKNDPFVLSLFKEYGSNMGEFLAPFVKMFDAKVLVIGGNITGAFDLFGAHLLNALEQNKIAVEVHLSLLKRMQLLSAEHAWWLKTIGKKLQTCYH